MGLGELFTRSVTYTATDSNSGRSETFVVNGGLAPDWSSGAYSGAMSLPGAWRASLLLSDLLGQFPWHVYRQDPGQPVQRLDPTPPLLEQPSPPDTRMTTFSSMGLDLVWHGNAVALIASRDEDGTPSSVLPVPADYVQVRRTTHPEEYVGVPKGTVVYAIGQDVYPWSDVMHIKGPCRPGALRGMSVLENHLNKTLSLADEQARQARQLGSMGIPSGLLKSSDPEFDEDDARDLKDGWMRNQRDRTIQVLNDTTTFEALAWNPTETQLLDARRFSLHETALIFGLDPSWLGVSGASMTYSNIEQEAINLIKFSLSGHLTRFEQAISSHLPPGDWAKANTDALLRSDTLSRYQAHALALQNRWMTVDEIRALEEQAPLTAEQIASFGTSQQVQPATGAEKVGS